MPISMLLAAALTPAADAAHALANQDPIPAAAVAILTCDSLDLGTAGVLVAGEPERPAAGARFNIGSNAKSMLATLAAILVRQGVLDWSDTVAASEAFAGVDIHPDLQGVTLAELLSHTSGVAAYASGDALNAVSFSGDARVQRARFAAQALSQPPDAARGVYLYSNAGYVIASEMIAAAGGADFFILMRERLFTPLGIDAHLGEPGVIGAAQPRGHTTDDDGPQPLSPDQAAIPEFLDPAGDVSLTVQDYGRYLQAHLCGLGGLDGVLPAADFADLHQPRNGSTYALGWARTDLPGGAASFHIGGTGAFTTIAALLPETGRGVAVMMNAGGEAAQSAGVSTVLTLLTPEE